MTWISWLSAECVLILTLLISWSIGNFFVFLQNRSKRSLETINAHNSSIFALPLSNNNGQGANEADGSSVASTKTLQASHKNRQGANETDGSSVVNTIALQASNGNGQVAIEVDGSSAAKSNISRNNSNNSAQEAEDDLARKRSRRFLNYTSSQWELMWLENIQVWEKNRTICENVLSSEQEPFLRKFQETICTHHIEDSSWCAVQDPYEGTIVTYTTR